MDSDYMQIGDLIPQEDGTYLDVDTGKIIDSDGELVLEPEPEEAYGYDIEEIEYW